MRAYRALPELPPAQACDPGSSRIVADGGPRPAPLRRPARRGRGASARPAARPAPFSVACPRLGTGRGAPSRRPRRAAYRLRSAHDRGAVGDRGSLPRRAESSGGRQAADDRLQGVERVLGNTLAHLRSALSESGLVALPADHLGWLVTAVIVGQMPSIPNMAPEVADRLARDAGRPTPSISGQRAASERRLGLAAIQIDGAAGRTHRQSRLDQPVPDFQA